MATTTRDDRTAAVPTSAPADVPADVPAGALAPAEQQGRMTHRQILSALSGMLLAMFVAFLSSTVVSNALPTIITELRGTQGQYTWVVTATLLASTASTPIWGKLADLYSKKLLIQVSIVVFVVGSMLAGLAQSVETLIAWRVRASGGASRPGLTGRRRGRRWAPGPARSRAAPGAPTAAGHRPRPSRPTRRRPTGRAGRG